MVARQLHTAQTFLSKKLKSRPKKTLPLTSSVRGGPGDFQSEKNTFFELKKDLGGFRRI